LAKTIYVGIGAIVCICSDVTCYNIATFVMTIRIHSFSLRATVPVITVMVGNCIGIGMPNGIRPSTDII